MISAKKIAHSINTSVKTDGRFGHPEILSMEVVFPKIVLGEAKTHRIISGLNNQLEITESLGFNDQIDFSRNSSSSRAIPINKTIESVKNNPFIPLAWQKKHSGMQGTEYITDSKEIEFEIKDWLEDRDYAIKKAEGRLNRGVTKQIANRLLEPFMWHKAIVTSTEWENFFELRCPQYSIDEEIFRSRKDAIKAFPEAHNEPEINWLKWNKSQAEIHIQALAEAMWDVYNESTPKKLKAGEWHIPFEDDIDFGLLAKSILITNDASGVQGVLCKIATAQCARVSYTVVGEEGKTDYEAKIKLHDYLIKSKHWSPTEHCAQASNKNVQSRNFRGFVQYREILEEM